VGDNIQSRHGGGNLVRTPSFRHALDCSSPTPLLLILAKAIPFSLDLSCFSQSSTFHCGPRSSTCMAQSRRAPCCFP
jgi:hypothetical protein